MTSAFVGAGINMAPLPLEKKEKGWLTAQISRRMSFFFKKKKGLTVDEGDWAIVTFLPLQMAGFWGNQGFYASQFSLSPICWCD